MCLLGLSRKVEDNQDFGLGMDDAFNAVKDVPVHGEYPATHRNKHASKD